MRALDHKIPPPVVAALVAALMWSVASLPPSLPLAPAVRYAAVAILAAAGMSFDLLGLRVFLRRRTTINPLTPGRTSAFVTDGIYRVTRNPMYLGLVLLLTAWAVYLASPWPFAGPALFILYMNRFQIGPEERMLRRLFGDEYAAYAARVRRWL